MDCQNVRLLLGFAQRRAERMDEPERSVVSQHLEACPDCAAFAQSEEAVDAAFASAMRAVAVPASLRAGVLRRLAAQRRPVPYAWLSAAAAVLLVAASFSGIYYIRQPAALTLAELESLVQKDLTHKAAEEWFAERRVSAEMPGDFNESFLQSYQVAKFAGRDVPLLVYADRGAYAEVYVLAESQFRTRDVPETQQTNSLAIRRQDGFVFVIVYRGDLDRLRSPGGVN